MDERARVSRRGVPRRASDLGGAHRRAARRRISDPAAAKLMLVFEHRMVDLVADRVGSRFKQLARLIGRAGSIVRK